MVMDILTIVILAAAVLHYAHRGFVRTILSALCWVGGFILGFLFCGDVRTFLCARTSWDESLQGYFARAFEADAGGAASRSVPAFLAEMIRGAQAQAAGELAAGMTQVILQILSFLLIVLAVRIAYGILALLFSKKHHRDDPIGLVDGVLGALFGLLTGILIVLLLYALLVPGLNIMPDTLSEGILNSLDHSLFSGMIYHENPLLSALSGRI